MQVELLRNPRDTLVVPESALVQQGRDHFVMRVGKGDKAERVQVRVGARRPGQAEVIHGLEAGQLVITHGNDKVRPGQLVRIQAIDDGTRPLAELLGAAP
jgi:membrane fusion protein (multidrug efflux system)